MQFFISWRSSIDGRRVGHYLDAPDAQINKDMQTNIARWNWKLNLLALQLYEEQVGTRNDETEVHVVFSRSRQGSRVALDYQTKTILRNIYIFLFHSSLNAVREAESRNRKKKNKAFNTVSFERRGEHTKIRKIHQQTALSSRINSEKLFLV